MITSLLLAICCTPASPQASNAAAPVDSFSFPSEWEEHAGTIMIFPVARYYGGLGEQLQEEFAALASSIVEHEPVHVFVHKPFRKRAQSILDERVELHIGDEYSIDWARDTAPMFVVNSAGERRAVCFQFNGWGEKYKGWKRDRAGKTAIAQALGIPIIRSEFVLEGGAIEIGSATGQMGIATRQCVLNTNRSSWSEADAEAELKAKLGLSSLLWLDKGLTPDPYTDGHVDGLLKFIGPGKVLVHTTSDKTDPNYAICQDAKSKLLGAGLEVIELPLAKDMVHMNFYIGSSGAVIYVPVCGDPAQDEPALQILREHFAKVIPIKATAIARAGGGIHCYTQQIPMGR